MSSNLKVNSLVPATGTEIGIGTTGGSIDFRCPATFGGNVTIGGTLTYDEVINIDSIGVITARSNIDCNGSLDVDGHTDLDNVSVAGVTTFSGVVKIPTVVGTNTNAALNVLFQTASGVIDGGSGLTYNPGGDVLTVNGADIGANSFRGSGALGKLTCDNHSSTTFVSVSNTVDIGTVDNATGAFTVKQGSNEYITIDTTNSSELIKFGTAGSERVRIDSSGRLLIGTTTEGHASADDLTINNSGHGGITIRTGTSSNGAIFFSDATSGAAEYDGYLQYNHGSSPYMQFGVAQSVRLYILHDGTISYRTGGGKGYSFNSSGSSADLANVFCPASYTLAFGTNSNERLRIDSSGRLIVGHDTALQKFHGPYGTNKRNPQIQINGVNVQQASMSITSWDNNVVGYYGPAIFLAKSGSSTIGTNSRVSNQNSILGSIIFSGDDGDEFVKGAMIQAAVDNIDGAQTGNNDMPGRLMFLTTADGAQEPSERLRITSDGNMGLGLTPVYSGIFGGAQRTFHIGGTAAPCLRITSSSSGQADLVLHAGNSGRRADIANMTANGHISIWTKPSSGSVQERIKIHPDGYVTKPATPAFFASHSGASNSHTGTLTYNTGTNGYYNNGSHLDVSSGRFHAPVDGIYYFHFHGFFQSGQNNASYEVTMRRSNSDGSGVISLCRQYGYRDLPTGQYGPSISMQLTCSMTAGQRMEMHTSTLSFHGSNGYYFGGYLIG